MKKILTIAAFILCSFTANEEKKYKFEFTMQELNSIWYVVDKSNAEHLTVEAVKAVLQKQYAAQTDTTKKK